MSPGAAWPHPQASPRNRERQRPGQAAREPGLQPPGRAYLLLVRLDEARCLIGAAVDSPSRPSISTAMRDTSTGGRAGGPAWTNANAASLAIRPRAA